MVEQQKQGKTPKKTLPKGVGGEIGYASSNGAFKQQKQGSAKVDAAVCPASLDQPGTTKGSFWSSPLPRTDRKGNLAIRHKEQQQGFNRSKSVKNIKEGSQANRGRKQKIKPGKSNASSPSGNANRAERRRVKQERLKTNPALQQAH